MLLKYLLFNCIKTSFGLQAEKGNANMVETPCHGNSLESMCELQPRAAALWDSLACTAARERSTSSLRSSMVRGLVSTIVASLLCHFVMTTSTLLDSQGNISKSSYPTNAFNTPAMFWSLSPVKGSCSHTGSWSCCVGLPQMLKNGEKSCRRSLNAPGTWSHATMFSVMGTAGIPGYLRSWRHSTDTSTSQSSTH